MINLFDNYQEASRDLHQSLMSAGYNQLTVVVNENGFLPDNVTSPFAYFTEMYETEGKPLYFNQVLRPDYWEVRGTNSEATIYDENIKRANIIYEPTMLNQRIVQRVEWLDTNNNIRSVDYYNKKGWRYAQTSYNLGFQPTMTSYYNQDGQEVIVENYTTKDIILNIQKKVIIFQSRITFINYFLKQFVGKIDRIIYNSLSVPFLVSYNMSEPGDDILFWQEKISENGELPGNMVALLEQDGRTKKIIIQDEAQYKLIINTHPDLADAFEYAGIIYPIKHKTVSSANSNALVLTNSDQIEQLEQLVIGLPQVDFYVAALTEMSAKLTKMSEYRNVRLYPNVNYEQVDRLLQLSDFYVDINHGSEILAGVRQAFLNDLLILSFENTIHNQQFISKEMVYKNDQVLQMIETIKQCVDDKDYTHLLLDKQHQHSNQSSIDTYKTILG
ncbi:accessory Sec system glycosylation chaperone GtfB [Leuconostoc sp. LN180020]|uniref:accessory Sec system glycosylation chaperone GtfB n=1 Tax=Leuconostoc sp. LN180020 TaxID=2571156 RepID=UPI001784AD00|nr:accessory Sec system glycosylation chaperone GtfB [Leuconostoc sp. LN180020]QOG10916.1 accessory Sec system glycosylation chaperone GtfB [Leuconostoc sp. LN180020]